MERINRISSESTGINRKAIEEEQETLRKSSINKYQFLEDQRLVMQSVLAKSTINSLELNRFYQGEMFEDRRKIDAFISSDPDFTEFRSYGQSRDEIRHKINILLTKLVRAFPFDYNTFKNDYWKTLNMFITAGNYEPSICAKFGVHFFLYAKTILILGNEQQHRRYVERACNLQDFGCFALTELTHGSNVQGCITTSTFDYESDSFIINTPHERGVKFWIGNAGQTANMSIVFANMIVNGKNYGIHPFIVPIRDPQNHHPMPGVTLVDCGDKMGMQGVDNGLMAFRGVKVPRENLLNRITQVDREGNVTSLFEKNSKRFAIQLASLSEGRVKVALAANTCAIQTTLIVVRFAAVRRQFGKKPNDETCLLDYPGWQDRIFPLFAHNFVYTFGIRSSNNLWRANSDKTFDSKNTDVKEMHSIISVVKSLATIVAQDTTQECRLAAGGLGYSSYSKLPGLVADCGVNVTWEGDSHILLQQTSRFLMKQYMKYLQGNGCKYPSLSFLSMDPAFEDSLSDCLPEELLDLSLIELIFERRCLKAIQFTVENLQNSISSGLEPIDAWNQVVPQGSNDSAILFGELFFLKEAKKALKECPIAENKAFMEKVIQIYALSSIRKRADTVAGFLSMGHISMIPNLLVKLYDSIKYDLVSFFDQSGFSDALLRTSIGSSDGNCYDRLVSEIMADRKNFGRAPWWKDIWRVRNGEM